MALLGIDVHTYLVKDPARATAFWRDTMGLACTRSSERGAEFELPDGSAFELWKPEDGNWQPGNGIMFQVPDVRSAVTEYRARGVHFDEHIRETPVCTMAFGRDSEGNSFILHERKAGQD